MKRIIVFVFSACLVLLAKGQFTQVPVALPNVYIGSADCADFNLDGYLDLAISGLDSLSNRISAVYTNNGNNTLSPLAQSFPGLSYGDVTWCDFNNDGFADLMILGQNGSDEPFTQLYSNNGDNTFSTVSYSFEGIQKGCAAWADYNRDGFTDVVISGESAEGFVTLLYENNGDSTFTAWPDLLVDMVHSTLEWNDFNHDGYPDLLQSGFVTSSANPSTFIYSNNGDGTFSIIDAGLQGVAYGTANWGDFNNDGLADVFVAGSYSGLKVYLYRNNGDSTFTALPTSPMEGLFHSSAQVFDYNNDGLTDIFISGYYGPKALLYKNTGNFTFVSEPVNITPVGYPAIVVADFLPDGKPDLLVAGEVSDGGLRKTRIYQNQYIFSNEIPTAPPSVSSDLSCGMAKMKWNRGSDTESQSSALTYSVYMVDSTGAYVIHPGADLADGRRYFQKAGNAGTDTFMIVHQLKPGMYKWGVQTIDLLNGASSFTVEDTIIIPDLPVANAGPDKAVCYGYHVKIDESELLYTPTGNYRWTSSGTGIFDNPASLAPVYIPTYTDLQEGSVKFSFEVFSDYFCLAETLDEKLISFAHSSIDIHGHSDDFVSVCEGVDTALWVSASGTKLSYQWLLQQTGGTWQPVEHATDSTLIFNGVAMADAGSYAFVVTDTFGCADTSTVALQLLVLENPDIPVIVASEEGLAPTQGFSTYEWLDGIGALVGSDSLFMPALAGDYSVRVTNNNICWSVSDVYAWNPVGISGSHWLECNVYPVPAVDHITLQISGEYLLNGGKISLYTLDGRKAGSWQLTDHNMTIPLSAFTRGLYLLEIADTAGNYYVKKINIR